MLVDDEPDILSAVKYALEQCPSFSYTVDGYSNPEVALDSFRGKAAEYSLVLTDVLMPIMNGFQLAAEITKIRNDIPVIFMTAFNVDESMPGYPSALRKENVARKPEDILRLCGIMEKVLVKVLARTE